MRKPLPPPGSDEAVQNYRRLRFVTLAQWAGVPFIAAAIIVIGSRVGLVLLAVLVILAPMGIWAQRKVLRHYRDRAYPTEP